MLIEATVATRGRTGVEMEALTAVATAALTIYDMVKAVDRGMTIDEIRLESKEGGRSGRWSREAATAGLCPRTWWTDRPRRFDVCSGGSGPVRTIGGEKNRRQRLPSR